MEASVAVSCDSIDCFAIESGFDSEKPFLRLVLSTIKKIMRQELTIGCIRDVIAIDPYSDLRPQ